MDIMYFFSQVLAFISMGLNIGSRFFKKQSNVLLVNIFSCLVGFFSNLLLLAFMGMAGLLVSTFRSIVFYYFSKNKWEKKLWLLFLFLGLQLVVCSLTSYFMVNKIVTETGKSFISCITASVVIDFILIFLKGGLFTIGAWQHNENVFRWLSIASAVFAVIYYFLLPKIGYANAASEIIAMSLIFYAIFSDAKAKKKALASAGETSSQVDTVEGSAEQAQPTESEQPAEQK